MFYLLAAIALSAAYGVLVYTIHGMEFLVQHNYVMTWIATAGVLLAFCSVTRSDMCRWVRRMHLSFLCRSC